MALDFEAAPRYIVLGRLQAICDIAGTLVFSGTIRDDIWGFDGSLCEFHHRNRTRLAGALRREETTTEPLSGATDEKPKPVWMESM